MYIFRYDTFVPVKARLPKWDIITEISAGRSWSMAKGAGGDLYTWGKGLRGQLGHGSEQICLAPRKVESFAAFVRISSGYAHNVCITTPKKHLNTALTEAKARHEGRAYNPFEPYVPATLKKTNSTTLFAFDCCRRTVSAEVATWRQRVRFRCLDCACTSICLLCARLCHRGHRLNAIDVKAIEVVENVEAPELEVQASDYVPYLCGVLYLSHKHVLRPKRVGLEVMPRVSILDVAERLKKPEPPPPPLKKGQKGEVKRRSREASKETEVNPRYLTVDRELHRFVRATQKAAEKEHRKFRHTTTKPKASNSSPSKSKTGTTTTSASTAAIPAAPKVCVPCCRCGVFNRDCRLIPVIPEHPDEDRLHAEELVLQAEERERQKNAPKVKIPEKGMLVNALRGQADKLLLVLTADSCTTLATGKAEATAGRASVVRRRTTSPSPVRQDPVPTTPAAASVAPAAGVAVNFAPSTKPGAATSQQPVAATQPSTAPTSVSATAASASLTSTKMSTKSGKSVKRKKATSDRDRDPTALRNHYLRREEGVRNLAARRIQRLGRRYMHNCRARRERLQFLLMRREVCAEHYHTQILDVVFGKVQKQYGLYREVQELAEMAQEETLTRVYTYYIKLQQGIIGIDALAYGLRQLCGQMTPALPRITVDGVLTDQWRPTYTLTYNSLRAQQLRLPALRRAPATVLTLAARYLPRLAEGGLREGLCTDTDLVLLTERYWKDQRTENWRYAVAAAAEKAEAIRSKIAALALERLKSKQNATKLAMQQAEAVTLRNQQKAVGGPPPPPAGPPPRFMVVRAAMEAKQERLRKHRLAVRDQERFEDAEFSITQKGLEVKWRQRRHTIADPCELYERVATMRSKLQQSNRLKRRNSLPGKIHLMQMPTQPVPAERIEQVNLSLELFTQRLNLVKRVQQRTVKSRVDSAYVESTKRRSKDHYVHWAGRLFQKAVLNPRLPCEMNALLVDGYRRRSIGEPERLARQLKVMMDTRETFCEFVESTMESFQYSRRRRSFDHGENRDAVQGVNDTLGFEFEEVKKVGATVTGLKKDSLVMEQQMVKAKFLEANAATASMLKEQEVQLTVNMANRFAKPNAAGSGAASAGVGGKKATRKDKAKGGLSGVRLAAEKPTEAQPAYDFSKFDAAAPSYDYGGGYAADGAVQPYQYDEYGNSAYEGSDGYTQSLTEAGGAWGEEGTLATWDDGSSAVTQYYAASEGQEHVWQEHYTQEGKTYYYNVATAQSSWEMPVHVDTQIETQNQDENGNWYWFNSATGESHWM
jgi:hypothetical protein